MNRDIHIGHLLEMDIDGKGYCSLLALSKQANKEMIIKDKLKIVSIGNNVNAA